MTPLPRRRESGGTDGEGAQTSRSEPARELLRQVAASTNEDLVPQVEDVISAMDFFDKAAGAQVLFI